MGKVIGNGYEDLEVWKLSKLFAVEIYRATDNFPAKEQLGLTSQIRRAAVSIPSNIAEGSVRQSDADFCRFLLISSGSAAELKTQLAIAKDIGFITETAYEDLANKINIISKMLRGLRNSIKRRAA